jgi:signal transduction histidine kinase
MHPLLSRQIKRYLGENAVLAPPWPKFLEAISDAYQDFYTHRETLERSLVLSTGELHQTNAEMRAVFQAIPDLLFRLSGDGDILDLKAGTTTDLLLPPRELIGKRIQRVPNRRVAQQFEEALRQVPTQKSVVSIEYSLVVEGQQCFYEARFVPLLTDQVDQVIVMVRNISSRIWAENDLERSHRQLLEASRSAGMADVVTSVLHNVGNILNSVSVSTHLVSSTAQSMHISSFVKAAEMLQEHAADLPAFLTDDARGKLLPGFLAKLAATLAAERITLLEEIERVAFNVNHICEIIAAQQTLAGVDAVRTTMTLGELIEKALEINRLALPDGRIAVVRDFDPAIPLTTDCHKILQVLVSLISNAKDAVNDVACTTRQITLRARRPAADRLEIAVCDTGVGIEPRNLTRIFSLGLTTKEGRHGFGLHTSALAAGELGGTLEAQSDGPGKGATFLLALPCCKPPADKASGLPLRTATDLLTPEGVPAGASGQC